MDAQVLEVHGVGHTFGEVVALRAVDVVVHAGEVVGLLGPNGAGKTTLVRCVATLLQPDDGSIEVCGIDVRRDPAGARAHLGLAGQHASVDELLTGRENLELIGRLYGIGAAECRARTSELLAALGLDSAAERRVGTYSGGMRRRLDLGATLIGEPSLLLLDEPTTGLDPWSRLELWALIEGVAARGAAVLVTSQNLEEVERLTDRVVVLQDGAVIADSPPAALQGRIGGHVIDVRTAESGASGDAGQVERALASAGLTAAVGAGHGRVTAPTDGGLASALDAGRSLLESGVEPVEFSLRTPSLEEAFLALTGFGSSVSTPESGSGSGDSPVGGALPERRPPELTRGVLRDVRVVTGRNVRRLLRSPQSVFFALAMPLTFVLGLSAVFGHLVERVLGEHYIQFLLPGVVVMQLALAGGATGVGLASDLQDGIIDRFRSLPMAQLAVLVGRTTTDLVRNTAALAIMVGAGFAIGYRLHGGVPAGLAAVGVALLFGYAVTWLFATVGLAVKDPEAANFVGFAPVLLFVYLSSAWVPIATMSGAVQGFARHQPVNVTIEAVRALADGRAGGAGGVIAQSIAWSAVLIAVFGALSIRLFRASAR